MAAPMLKSLGSRRLLRLCRFSDIYRTYLKEGYSQDEIWKQRLQSKYLQKLDAKAFGIELLENFEKTTTFHVVDIDLFVNKIQDLPPSFGYLANEVLYRFRHCQSSVPVKENIMHAIVRGFLESGDLDRLVEIIKDKSKYGVFPDALSMTMLIDHFLKQKNYEVAAQLAYEVMLGEEYKNQTRNFLSLCAALKYYIHTFNHERPEPVPVDEEEEVVYKPVKVIRNLYYDDHFDIKDDRFLLGKTFYLISKNTPRLEGTFSRSLQLLGLGLYDKFELGNKLLEQWIKDDSLEKVVYKSARRNQV
ncbi:small ribosomal subunit protein mS27-like [Ruditapes philippinarum]|uniref:small ribosomal subunit protein mS27-like n=1 Tax=Ruditapes philippinarum TaxID=129788 RepID=UPI00295B9CA8|nr:small ribosomal subunit protein mS27-like [Ruditapes philippinarum]